MLGNKTYPDSRIWIYNSKGQLVKLIDMETNIHWDGKDDNHQPVGDGIYYYKHFDWNDMRGYKVNKLLLIR
jgi:flagellar hook assembly protein FlgD